MRSCDRNGSGLLPAEIVEPEFEGIEFYSTRSQKPLCRLALLEHMDYAWDREPHDMKFLLEYFQRTPPIYPGMLSLLVSRLKHLMRKDDDITSLTAMELAAITEHIHLVRYDPWYPPPNLQEV